MVTGSRGFIGTHLVAELKRYGHEVFGIDHWHSQWDLRIPRNVERIFNTRDYDACFHLAAKVGRLFGEDDVQETIADNAGMTALVARACGERGVRLLYASTSEVYGDRGEHLCREDDVLTGLPHNAYGLTKRHGEEFCQLYAPDGLTILRFSMPYGPGLPAGRGRAALINFLYNAVHRQPLTVHRGSERSWCWIEDTVKAARLVFDATDGGTFNIGRDDNATSMRDVAEIACNLVGAPLTLITEVDPPARQTVVKRLSTEMIRSLGWRPKVELPEGIHRTLDWVMAQPAPAEQVAV